MGMLVDRIRTFHYGVILSAIKRCVFDALTHTTFFKTAFNPYLMMRRLELMPEPPYPEFRRGLGPPVITPPNMFWGLITKNGVTVPDGLTLYAVLETKDDSGNDLGLRVRATAVTELLDFEGTPYNYTINVPIGGMKTDWEAGKPVSFYIGSEYIHEAPVLIGVSSPRHLDLHVAVVGGDGFDYKLLIIPASLLLLGVWMFMD